MPCSVEYRCGARVLTSVEKRRAEEVAELEPQRRIMVDALNAVL
jgi:hypothetical protein